MTKLLLAALTALTLTLTAGAAFGASPATSAASGQLAEGTIIVIGPFPLEVVTGHVESAPLVVDMQAPRLIDVGLFTVDLDRGEAWLSPIAATDRATVAPVIEMPPMAITVDRDALPYELIELEPLVVVATEAAPIEVAAAEVP